MKNFLNFPNFVLALIFLIVFFLLTTSAMQDSVTTDEHIHLFSGYTYLTQRDFRLDPEHPPLIKELAALPLLVINDIQVNLDKMWVKAGNFYYDSWQETRTLSDRFLYEWNNNPSKILFWGRLPSILITLLLGLAVFVWANKLYGKKAGVFAAFLILFLPNILAHGRLINTDIGLTLFFFITIYFWTKFLKEPNFLNFLYSGLFLGLTLATKFTGLIIIFVLLITLVIRIILDKKNWLKYILGFLGIFVITFFIIWLTYGFSTKIFAAPPASIAQNIRDWLRISPPVWFDNFFSKIRVIFFPADYFKGAYFVFRHSVAGHGSYLLGQTSNTGWWYYFPIVIYYKTPIPFFIFLILALVYQKKLSKSENRFDEFVLLLAPMVFLGISMLSKANLGVRHIMPIFPFLIVYASRSINLVQFNAIKFYQNNLRKIIPALLFLILILWYLYSSIMAWPNYLAYFNELAGGSKNGYKIVSDSNLDWGQDMIRIKKYLKQNQITDYEMYYPWSPDKSFDYYGLQNNPLDQHSTKPKIVSTTFLNFDYFDWIKKYPYKEITPGVSIHFPN